MAFRKDRPVANPIDQFIRDLGGPAAVAKELGLRASTVNSWQLTGKIPKWRIEALAAFAVRENIAWPVTMDRAA